MAERVVILGNSGSGKTHLACTLAGTRDFAVIHLDTIFWVPGGFHARRDAAAVEQLVGAALVRPRWVAEGVFGELASRFLESADLLLWLDLPWGVCHAGLQARGAGDAASCDPDRARENFRRLLTWAEAYWTRTDLRSHAGHQRLFDAFRGEKLRFRERSQVDDFVGQSQPHARPGLSGRPERVE